MSCAAGSVAAAPAGKSRHSTRTLDPGGLTEGKGGTRSFPKVQGVLANPTDSLPQPHTQELPEEQPKVISQPLRGLFKAAAAGRAPAGLGRVQSE